MVVGLILEMPMVMCCGCSVGDHTADVIMMVVHHGKVMSGDCNCPIQVKLRASTIGFEKCFASVSQPA